jgi:hypothetical protein
VNRFGTKLETAVALRELSTLLSSLFYRYGESPFWREKSKEFPVISIYFSGKKNISKSLKRKGDRFGSIAGGLLPVDKRSIFRTNTKKVDDFHHDRHRTMTVIGLSV